MSLHYCELVCPVYNVDVRASVPSILKCQVGRARFPPSRRISVGDLWFEQSDEKWTLSGLVGASPT